MGRLKGEAGESPALSRNCDPLLKQREARSPALTGFHALAEGSGSASAADVLCFPSPLSDGQGFLFLPPAGTTYSAPAGPRLYLIDTIHRFARVFTD